MSNYEHTYLNEADQDELDYVYNNQVGDPSKEVVSSYFLLFSIYKNY